MATLALNADVVNRLLTMPKCIELMKTAFLSLAEGTSKQPLRDLIMLPGNKNVFGLMPCAVTLEDGMFFGIKGQHGQMVAMADAHSVTQIRTAAVSGLATQYCARSDDGGQNPLVCAILGAGVQAESHIEAVSCVRKLSKVLIWNRTSENAHKLAKRLQPKYAFPLEVVGTLEEAIIPADIICATTAASEPIIKREWVKAGAHINAVGSSSGSKREVDSQTVKDSVLVADSIESLVNEAGEYIIPKNEGVIDESHIFGELADIVSGLAIEDIVSVKYVYDEAQKEGLTSFIELGHSQAAH